MRRHQIPMMPQRPCNVLSDELTPQEAEALFVADDGVPVHQFLDDAMRAHRSRYHDDPAAFLVGCQAYVRLCVEAGGFAAASGISHYLGVPLLVVARPSLAVVALHGPNLAGAIGLAGRVTDDGEGSSKDGQ